MSKFYIMERKGVFISNTREINQCKEEGHKNYEYSCKIFFEPKTTLDTDDFVIDHNEINDAVSECQKAGSCERMHINIMNAILKKLTLNNIDAMAIKVTITPIYPGGMAILSHAYVRQDKYLPLVV